MEQSHMAETGVSWLLNQNQTESFIVFGANSVWHALQLAVRAFLIQEHDSQVVYRLLRLDKKHQNHKVQSHISAIGHWLAVRATERDLLPLLLQAGQFLGINGFDSSEDADAISKRQFVQLLPYVYNGWAKGLPQALRNIKLVVEAELDFVLEELSINRESLVHCIQRASNESPGSGTNTQYKCLTCSDNYFDLGSGLVQPRRISFIECRITRHKFFCQCREFLRALGVLQRQPVPDDVDVDEEFFKETGDDVDQLCKESDRLYPDEKIKLGDPFHDAATMLYRVQGRRWIETYEPSELLCATCFLKREGYIGENGSIHHHRFTPAPKNYISRLPPDSFTSTF